MERGDAAPRTVPSGRPSNATEAWGVSAFPSLQTYNPDMLSAQEIDVYVRAYRQPGAVRGSCMDYRAEGLERLTSRSPAFARRFHSRARGGGGAVLAAAAFRMSAALRTAEVAALRENACGTPRQVPLLCDQYVYFRTQGLHPRRSHC